MKGVRIHEFGGPEVLRWEEIPDPECPPRHVVVEVKAASVNHLDLWVREGVPRVSLPIVMGSDGSGVVVEVGRDVDDWLPGDEVVIQPGTYCGKCDSCLQGKENYCVRFGILGETEDGTQRELMPIEIKYLERKPATVSFEEAAAFSLVFLTAHAMLLRRAQVREGETVLVLGASSGVGSASIQISKLLGCQVIATGGSEKKLQLAKDLGANHVVNHREEEIHKRVKEFTDGRGVDVVLEHVGAATWQSSLRSLAKGGRLVTCGATTGSKVEIDLRHLYWKQQSILGSTMGDAAGFKELVGWLREGKVKPVLDRTFPMSAVADAHRYIEERKQLGKVVLVSDVRHVADET